MTLTALMSPRQRAQLYPFCPHRARQYTIRNGHLRPLMQFLRAQACRYTIQNGRLRLPMQFLLAQARQLTGATDALMLLGASTTFEELDEGRYRLGLQPTLR
jgi:hypothetical protein